MQPSRGIRLDTYVPVIRKAGESVAIETWTWWHFEVARLANALAGSQGPWMVRTEWHLWVTWIVTDETQLDVLIDFLGETRREFALDGLSFEYHPVMFGLIE